MTTPQPEIRMSMASTAAFLDAFERLCKGAYTNSKDKGFWNPDPATGGNPDNVSIPTKFLLMVSELCEAFEAYRKKKLDAPCDKDAFIIDPESREPVQIPCHWCSGSGFQPPNERSENVVCPSCVKGKMTVVGMRRLTNEEEEMADVIIRIADYCGWRNIDLGRCVISKMAYNATRPHMHGGKTC